jgi:hypothetical protein
LAQALGGLGLAAARESLRARVVLSDLGEAPVVLSVPFTSGLKIVEVGETNWELPEALRGRREWKDPAYQVLVREGEGVCDEEIDRLQSELDSARRDALELRARNELLESENDKLETRQDKMLETIGALSAAQRTFAALLAEQKEGKLTLREKFDGEVTRIVGDDVGVTFDVQGDLVEHVYHRDQLQGGVLPQVADRVTAISFLFTRPAPPLDTAELEKALRDDYLALKKCVDDRKIIEPED